MRNKVMHPDICLDTNIILRLIDKESTIQSSQAQKLIDSIKSGEYRAIIPGIVLAEVVWVLKSFYKISKQKQVDFINSLQSLPNTTVVDQYHWGMASSFYEMFKLKFTDAALISVLGMSQRPTLLATFDAELLSLKIKGVNVVHPRDL